MFGWYGVVFAAESASPTKVFAKLVPFAERICRATSCNVRPGVTDTTWTFGGAPKIAFTWAKEEFFAIWYEPDCTEIEPKSMVSRRNARGELMTPCACISLATVAIESP